LSYSKTLTAAVPPKSINSKWMT